MKQFRKEKNFLTKVTSTILTVALIIGVFISPEISAAKEKVALSSSNISINVGKSKTLQIKNSKKKAVWKVISGKKNITLSHKKKASVVITAKKKGTAKVQAKIGKKKYTCTVTVKAGKANVEVTASPVQSADTTPTPVTEATPTPEAEVTPTPVATVAPTPNATVTPTPEAEATPTPMATVAPTPVATVAPTPVATVTPTPVATTTPTPSPEVSGNEQANKKLIQLIKYINTNGTNNSLGGKNIQYTPWLTSDTASTIVIDTTDTDLLIIFNSIFIQETSGYIMSQTTSVGLDTNGQVIVMYTCKMKNSYGSTIYEATLTAVPSPKDIKSENNSLQWSIKTDKSILSDAELKDYANTNLDLWYSSINLLFTMKGLNITLSDIGFGK